VASAGNDATCVPAYPAALPEVVGLGALDDGRPAPFTNYGPWVRACTEGTDVVSLFYDGFNGAEPPAADGKDLDRFEGWARWSGTSFAAPRVLAALARRVAQKVSPQDAVGQLIDDEKQARQPMLGTVVLP
jgi:subtilisin family serine protease